MRLIWLAIVLVFAQAQTTQDGMYTEAQAKRGAAIYSSACASCHGLELAGDGPSLVGKDFNNEWNDMPLSDLYERIQATMPADAPGSLKPAEAADVIAYLLNKGRFPAGQTELPSDVKMLKALEFVTPKP